ncbi:hypothetical protein JC2156_16440 [Weissella koreensis KCTC 3621]|nr:hypothetical protein JC2156_16440 [Weissella koreensis KCTC 3621]
MTSISNNDSKGLDSDLENELPETFAAHSKLSNIVPNIMELLGVGMLLKKNKNRNK